MNFSTKTAVMLAKPIIKDVLADMIKSGSVTTALWKVKSGLIESILDLTKLTHFSWDDELAETIIQHLLESGTLDALSEKILSALEAWIRDTNTKWDDEVVLPVISGFRSLIVENGGKDE